MAQIKVVANFGGDILEWGRVVWGDKGQPFCFEVSKFGTDIALQAITQTGDIDAAELAALINLEQGVIRQNNPKHADVKTDADDDGISDEDGTRYGWAQEGQLYTATVA